MKKAKYLISLLLVLVISLGVFGCSKDDDPTIDLSEQSVNMNLFETRQLTVNTNISGTVEWSNSDDTVVNMTESSGGIELMAIKTGSATITASVGGYSKSCAVTVYPTDETILLAVERTEINFTVGETAEIQAQATFDGQSLAEAQISYTVAIAAPAGCIEVSETGQLTAVKTGTAQVKVKAEYFGNPSNEVTVNVTAVPSEPTDSEPPEVTFSIQETAEVDNKKVVSVEETVLYDNTVQLTASLNVDGQDIAQADAGIVWAVTEGQDVASVDSATGTVTGLKEGTAVITATYTDRAETEHTDTCTVTVNGVVRYGTHEWFEHDSIIATIPSGSSLRYDNVSLTTGETPLIRVQMIPEKLLENADSYNFGVGNDPASPTAPDTETQRGLRMFYITVSDAEDASNYVTIAIRVYPGDGFSMIAGSANVGARASTFPAFTPGLGTPNQYTDFYGAFNGDATNPNSPFGISGGYGTGGPFSFYGGYLDEERYPDYEKYMMGFSIEGTVVYMYNNGVKSVVWDLADTTSQAALADSAWGGFTSDKVNISIRGDHFEAGYSEFTLAITELGGAAVSETAVTDMYYHTWINDGTALGLM